MELNPQEITIKDQLEVWWDQEVIAIRKVKHNRPDMLIWNTEESTCKLVEVTKFCTWYRISTWYQNFLSVLIVEMVIVCKEHHI